MSEKRKTLAIPEDLHADWTAKAARDGLSLIAYVTRAVAVAERPENRSLAGIEVRPQNRRPLTSTVVSPEKCTNRLRAGTWCRLCGTVHKKGS